MRREHKEVKALPSGYRQLEYIQTSYNLRQYIDTGLDPYMLETEIKFKECQNSIRTGNLQLVGGCWNASDNRYYIASHVSYNSAYEGYLCSITKTNNPIRLHEIDLSKTHVVIYNNDNNEVVCDGVVKWIIPDITVPALTNKIVLFGGREGSGMVRRSAWRIHYAKFRRKDLNELVGYFVPVLDSQGVPCMYDYVSRNTFYNHGTGTFLYA